MKVIICYDITDDKLRYKMVKHLESFAIRVQYSVFKADINDKEILKLNQFADKFVLICLNWKIFKEEDFFMEEGRCLLKDAARNRFMMEYEEYLGAHDEEATNTLRSKIDKEIECFKLEIKRTQR